MWALSQQPDRPGLPRDATDQPAPLQRDDHVVHGRRRHLEELLEVRFGRRLPVEQRVGVDERQYWPCFVVNRGDGRLDMGSDV